MPEGVLIADDGQFLGNVNDDRFDPNSIANRYGTHGNRHNSYTIWSRYGTYSGTYMSLSPWNDFTTTPPIIFFSDDTFIFVTANSSISPAIHPNELAIIVGRLDVLRD